MTQDILTAYALNQSMVAKSAEVDQALAEYRDLSVAWSDAENISRKRQAQAYAFCKGKTVNETRALIDIECDAEIAEALRLDAIRNGAKEALRARLSQLSALQSQATALREELKLARTDNYSGGP